MKRSVYLILLMLCLSGWQQAQTRVVLIEQFTNSGCPPCAAETPVTLDYVNNNSNQVVAIAYHTSFPYKDSMHLENVSENKSRTGFYSVQSVPYTVMDGNVFTGTSASFNSNAALKVNSRAAMSPDYEITRQSLTLVGKQLSGYIRFTSLNTTNAGEALVAHMLVIEKNVLKTAYAASPGENTETQYGYVMRKMLPDTAGLFLINKGLNGTDLIPLNWTIDKIKDVNELRVVVFVQNVMTKEIYQADLFKPDITVGMAENQMEQLCRMSVFPNPSPGAFSIAFDKEESINSLRISNQLNETVYTENVHKISDLIKVDSDLSPGVYFLSVVTASGTASTRIVVLH